MTTYALDPARTGEDMGSVTSVLACCLLPNSTVELNLCPTGFSGTWLAFNGILPSANAVPF